MSLGKIEGQRPYPFEFRMEIVYRFKRHVRVLENYIIIYKQCVPKTLTKTNTNVSQSKDKIALLHEAPAVSDS